jgi:hypothetical protein
MVGTLWGQGGADVLGVAAAADDPELTSLGVERADDRPEVTSAPKEGSMSSERPPKMSVSMGPSRVMWTGPEML